MDQPQHVMRSPGNTEDTFDSTFPMRHLFDLQSNLEFFRMAQEPNWSCQSCSLCSCFEELEPERLFACSANQKLGDHPNSRKNALGVKRPFSELPESSGVFSEQLSEFKIPFSEYEILFSEWHPAT